MFSSIFFVLAIWLTYTYSKGKNWKVWLINGLVAMQIPAVTYLLVNGFLISIMALVHVTIVYQLWESNPNILLALKVYPIMAGISMYLILIHFHLHILNKLKKMNRQD